MTKKTEDIKEAIDDSNTLNLEALSQQLDSLKKQVSDNACSLKSKFSDQVKDKPIAAIASAFAVGALVSLIFKK